MSVWVPVSTSCDSDGGVNILVRGVLLSTCTTMGSLAVLKASTAWSWVALDKSLPLTCGKTGRVREADRQAEAGKTVLLSECTKITTRGWGEGEGV